MSTVSPIAEGSEVTTATGVPSPETATEPAGDPPRRRRRKTSHLKDVPQELALREAVRDAAKAYLQPLDTSQPWSKDTLEQHARQLLTQLGQPERFLGFAMVLLGNAFWRRQFLATPFDRRLLLLPHCLKHADGCPADYDEFGLDCERCGACSIADYKGTAEKLGYKVLVAEGSPVVLRIIVEGYVDGILGVACLNVLEKAIDKVLLAGVPSYAVPLHSGNCRNTTLDQSWVWEVLDKYEPLETAATRSYIPLMRTAASLFEPATSSAHSSSESASDAFSESSSDASFDSSHESPSHSPSRPAGDSPTTSPSAEEPHTAETIDPAGTLDRLLPPPEASSGSPLAFTQEVARSWLATGGKRSRPFMTLAAYEALKNPDALPAPQAGATAVPESVAAAAVAIEAFHKASLVHDDIQDDDLFRYGEPTLHRTHGVGQAINIGDHLIGQGYRLLRHAASRHATAHEEPGIAGDLVGILSDAHLRLCEGQGAEMRWSSEGPSALTPIDALRVYALKTSPAFEAALLTGLRLAGDVEPYREPIAQFAKQLGVGFQILNDLDDLRGDEANKVVGGQDLERSRPTVLMALAWAAADATGRSALLSGQADEVQAVLESSGAISKAEGLVEKSRARAEAIADEIVPESLRALLYFLVDTVLAHGESPTPEGHPGDPALPTFVPLQA